MRFFESKLPSAACVACFTLCLEREGVFDADGGQLDIPCGSACCVDVVSVKGGLGDSVF